MKKLLFFSHGLSANGIETFLVNVLGELDKSKYDISLVIAIDEGVYSLNEQKVLDMGVNVIHACDMDSVKKKFLYIKKVKEILEREKYDVVHANMDLLNGIVLGFAAKAGVPKRISHAHSSKSQYKPSGAFEFAFSLAQKIYSSFMKRLIAKYSTSLLACSDVAGKYFYNDNQFEIINNGIKLSYYCRTDNLSDSNEAKKLIVSVGRISAVKKPDFALEVIKALSEIRSDFKYAWVGTGELEEQTKKKAKALDIENFVEFMGLRTDIPQILKNSDVFLMPSLFEGLPMTLVEAQAAGLRCVVSDAVTSQANFGGIRYLSLNDGAKKWAEALSSELDSGSADIDAEKIKKFDISYTAKQLEAVYDSD